MNSVLVRVTKKTLYEKCTDNTSVKSSVVEDLKKWAVDFGIPDSHLDSLLKVLKHYHPELPITSKTLLKTNLNFKKTYSKV